jgi:hypothetical protein
MKEYFLAVLLCAVGSVSAQVQRMDVAKYSTRNAYGIVQQSGWIDMTDTDNARFWFAYGSKDLRDVTVALKIATKSIGDGYTTIETDIGSVDCSHASAGIFPNVLHMFVSQTDDANSGGPVPGYSDLPPVANVPLERGTAIAEAVKRSCVDSYQSAFAKAKPRSSDDPLYVEYIKEIQGAVLSNWPKLPDPWPSHCDVNIVQSTGGKVTSAKVVDGCKASDTDIVIVESYVQKLTLPYVGFENEFVKNLTLTHRPSDY